MRGNDLVKVLDNDLGFLVKRREGKWSGSTGRILGVERGRVGSVEPGGCAVCEKRVVQEAGT